MNTTNTRFPNLEQEITQALTILDSLPIKRWYVSIQRDSRRGLLLGPLESREYAESLINDVRRYVHDNIDPFTAFDSFGVAEWKQCGTDLPRGTLNEAYGL